MSSVRSVVATGVGLNWGEGVGLGVLVHVAVAAGVSEGDGVGVADGVSVRDGDSVGEGDCVGVAVWLGVLLRGCDTAAAGTVGAATLVAVAVRVGDGLGSGRDVGLAAAGQAVVSAPVGIAAAAGLLLQPARLNTMISSRQAASTAFPRPLGPAPEG
jgi:hypothetical protein